MSLRKLRIVIPTKGKGSLEDVVSDVFGRANTFTIVDVEQGAIKNVKVLEKKTGLARTSDLAKDLNVALGSITNTLVSLEKKSLIIRKPYHACMRKTDSKGLEETIEKEEAK